jgi:CheY-like chemotaxis protein
MTVDVLVIARGAEMRQALEATLFNFGYKILVAENAAKASAIVKKTLPVVVLADITRQDNDDIDIIRRMKKENRDLEIIALAEVENRAAVLRRFKDDINGFITKPADSEALEVGLREAVEKISLREKLKEQSSRLESGFRGQPADRVETERLLAVKQIVDKLSSFIGRLARDVEGGVKYFNEMPYFVSIHNRDLKVVAANQTYRTMLGKHEGSNSWDVYSGKAAEAQNCPVGKTFMNFLEIFAVDKAAYDHSPIRQTFEDGKPHQAEMVLTAKNSGKIYKMLAWSSPFR